MSVWLSIAEAAEELGVKPFTVYRWCVEPAADRSALPCSRRPGSLQYFIREEDLRSFAEREKDLIFLARDRR